MRDERVVALATSGRPLSLDARAFAGIKDGGTDIACCGPAVPKAAVDKIMAARKGIIDGKHVYAGPLSDRDGKERVAAGSVLSDGDLWKMDWFVQGVITQK